jgi:hypothetical protein
MISSKSELQTTTAHPASTTSASIKSWKSTCAFIQDQLLQFWPPYRAEVHDDEDAS